MTTIKIYDNHIGQHIGFEMSGHAGYARRGKEDIVCAALSMLMTVTVNSIECLAKAEYSYEEDEKDGYMKIMVTSEITHDVDLLFSSMILGLSQLEENYPKNVRLIIEEVQSC